MHSIAYDLYCMILLEKLHLYLDRDGFDFLSVQLRCHGDDPGVPVHAEVGLIFIWSDWEEHKKWKTLHRM